MNLRFLVLLGPILLMQGQVSLAEGLPEDTAAVPTHNASSAALSGAPLPGIPNPEHAYMALPDSPSASPEAVPKPAAPVKKPEGIKLIKTRVLTCFYPLRHPRKAFNKAIFPIAHPLQFGKACESNGTNGLLGFVGGCANVGTTCILGARKF